MLAAVSCSSAEQPVTLEVLTWWTEGGEKQALQCLLDVHKKKHPNVSFSTTDATSAEKAFEGLDTRFELGVPPDTFQVNGGAKLLSRVIDPLVDSETTAKPSLQATTDVFEQAATQGIKILEGLTPLIDVGGEKYGVPVNVHRINNLYYNPSKLKGNAPPEDLDSFVDLVRELSGKDENGTPALGKGALGIGVGESWTREELVFENLLPSVVSQRTDLLPDEQDALNYYGKFWSGGFDLFSGTSASEDNRRIARELLEQTLITAQELWPYVKTFSRGDTDGGQGKWSDPFVELTDPRSSVAFVVMGDWATGYLKNLENGPTPTTEGVDFEVMPFPGTSKLFIYTTDVFTLTANTKKPEAVRDFLRTVLSVDAQIKFSQEKGSIPAIDLDSSALSRLSESQRRTMALFKDESIVKAPAISGLFTTDIPAELLRDCIDNALGQPPLGHDVAANRRDAVYQMIANYYWMLQDWNKKQRAAL